jgi:MFS family permease
LVLVLFGMDYGTNVMATPGELNETYFASENGQALRNEIRFDSLDNLDESGDFHEHVSKLQRRRKLGMQKVVHLAVGFFFLFAAYNTIQNYVTSLLPGCLGFTSLCVLYVSVCPSLMLAPSICKKLGDRYTLVLGSLCYAVWIASLTRADNQWLVLGASVVIGFGAAILWVAQGSYLTSFGDSTNRSVLAGTFWSIYQCSGVMGNGGAYFVLNSIGGDDNSGLYAVGLALSVFASLVFFCLTPLVKDASWEADEQASLLRSQARATAGSIEVNRMDGYETDESSTILDDSPNAFAPVEEFKKEWAEISAKKMEFLCLSPLLFLTGYELAFVSGEFPIIFAPGKDQKAAISLVFVVWAIAEVVSSYTVGKVSSIIGKRLTLTVGSFLFLVALSIVWQLHQDPRALGTFKGVSILAYVAGALFGVADCTFNVIVLTKLGDLFPSRGTAGAFTAFQFLQNIASAIAFFLPVLFSNGGGDSCSSDNQSDTFKLVYMGSQAAIVLLSLFGFWIIKSET